MVGSLNIIFRDIKTQSHKGWMKEHKDCYIKKIEVNNEGKTLKAKHCADHNCMFIYKFE